MSKVANKSVLVPPEIVQQMGALMSDMADSYESNVNLEREALAVQGRLGRIDPADLEAALPKIGRPKAAPKESKADQWERLVASGMSPAEATARLSGKP